VDPMKEHIGREVEAFAQNLYSISDFLKDNPEVAYHEFKACEHLSRVLTEQGFKVETGIGNLETAFLACPDNCQPSRPVVAFLAEYDALPKVGHGCGHNMIAAASLGAAIALRRILGDAAGSLAVVGTPAEEGGGGKVLLAEAGVFDEIDAAMMFHPGLLNIPGKLRADGRIHGIITHGGDAPNIIPDYAAGLFYVRAGSRAYLDELFERVKNCARGAALAIGAESKIEIDPPTFDPFKRNAALEAAVRSNMDALGILIDPDDGRRGSSDIGNLSHYLPAIHPWLAIVGPDIPGHSSGFCEATTSALARETLLKAAKLLAMTAYDFLTSAELRNRAMVDFKESD